MKENPSNSSPSPPHPHSSSIPVMITSITKKTKPRVQNGGPPKKTSIYKGVTKHKLTGRCEAHLWDRDGKNENPKKKGKQVYLGGYESEDAAARTYDLAALKYWGVTTTLNFPLGVYEKEIAEMQNWTKEQYVAYLRRQSSGFSRGVSKYRGVAKHHVEGKWEARIGKVGGKRYLYLGIYDSEVDAAIAYDQAAIKHKGSRAVTNFFNQFHPNENNIVPQTNDAREDDEQQDRSLDEQGKDDEGMNVLSQMHEFSNDINSFKDEMIDIKNWLDCEVEQSWSSSPNIEEFPQLNVFDDGNHENSDEMEAFSPLFNSGSCEILDESAPSFDYNHHENPGELLNFSESDSHKKPDDLHNYEMSAKLTPSVNEISLADNNFQSSSLFLNEQPNQNYQLNQHGIVNDEYIAESAPPLDYSHQKNHNELFISIDDFALWANHDNHEKPVEPVASINDISLLDNNISFVNLFPNEKSNQNYQVNPHGILNDNFMQRTTMNSDLDQDITSSYKYRTGGKTHHLVEKEAMEKKMHFQC